MLLLGAFGCGEGGGASAGPDESGAAMEAERVDSSDAKETCAEGLEPLTIGEAAELPDGGHVTLHDFQPGETYEQLGTEMHAALMDVELCAGTRRLGAPFTNRDAFSLCESLVESGTSANPERVVYWSSPDPIADSPDPALPSVIDDLQAGECARGWVTMRTAEGEPGWEAHLVVYDTSFFTDTESDQVRAGWTID